LPILSKTLSHFIKLFYNQLIIDASGDEPIMNTLYVELEAAMECELVVKALDILVDIAALHTENGETTSAAEILALVMEYPARAVTLERAIDLFDTLEWQLCPRVISDARDLAQEMTLDDMVARLLSPANRL
jgi:hypothetical protein